MLIRFCGLIYFFVSLVTAHLADGVLEHNILFEEVVYGYLVNCVVVLRALEEEAQEALCAVAACTLCKVGEEHQVEAEGSCQDRVAAEEVDLDLHGIAHPAEDVDVVPSFLVVVAGRIVVDAYFVVVVCVEVGLFVGNEN